MNVRDPFNLRRSPAFAILRGTNVQTAATITKTLLESGANKIITSSRQLAEDIVETAEEVTEQIAEISEQMSFSIPKNVPSFDDPQRQLENHAWGASGVTSRAGPGNVADKLGGYYERNKNYFDGTNRDLPLYKDKPYYTAKAKRRQPLWRRRRVFALAGLVVMGILYLFGFLGGSSDDDSDKPKKKEWSWLRGEKAGAKVDWSSRQKDVVEAFTQSWDAYERYAWGYDEFHPVSQKGKQMTPKGMGWIIVDALDTLMLMNLTSRLTTARTWIDAKLDYDQDQEVNTFETTIRMIGGLLSAHYLSTEFPFMAPIAIDSPTGKKEDLYIEKAKDLADRVMGAFESKSGVPYASVNLRTFKGVYSHDDGGASSTAEAATLQLEYKYLSKLTGEVDYWEKAEKVMEVLDNNGATDGLVPIYVYAQTGTFRGDNIRLGSRGDSYYEYLIKQYLQTNEPIYKDMWNEALNGVRKHLITYSEPTGFTVLGERQGGLNGILTPKMDHLVCFMPGTIALAATGGLPEAELKKSGEWGVKQEADMKLARELMQTCWGMYKYMATGLAAEITHFKISTPHEPYNPEHQSPPDSIFDDQSPDAAWQKDFIVKQSDLHNLQRPETVESLFYMYRITGEEKYREWGWDMFKSFMNHTAVELGGGFTSLSNANVIPAHQRDNMESFWLVSSIPFRLSKRHN